MSFAFVILVLMAFFCAVAFRQQLKRDKVNAGGQDELIKKVLSRYRKLRENQEAVNANAFVIGPAQEDHKGNLRDNPKALAVRILDEKGKRRAVLTRIKQKIEERYPDDFVGRAPNYLTVVIDGKKLLKHLDG